MNLENTTTLIRYNFWANARVLAACTELTPDEFLRPISPDPGWGSLRGVLVHILDTEFGWRSVLQAQDSGEILVADDFRDVAALMARWEIEKAAWLDYVRTLGENEVGKGSVGEGQSLQKAWQTIMHVITHGIQHRSEAAWILTGYGYSPGELDFDIYLRENPVLPGD